MPAEDSRFDRERELNDQELRELRALMTERERLETMLDEWDRSKWLWGMIGKASAWIGGVIAVVITFRDVLGRILKGLIQ